MTGCPVAHDYDPFDPAIVLDPYPVLNRLRREQPVFYLPDLDHYIVTRLDDIEAILTDRTTWSAANASSPLMPVCAAAQAVLDSGFTAFRRSTTPTRPATGRCGSRCSPS